MPADMLASSSGQGSALGGPGEPGELPLGGQLAPARRVGSSAPQRSR